MFSSSAKCTFVCLLFIFSALALAQTPVNVSGDWELTLSTPRGDRVMSITIVQEDTKLKVTLTVPQGYPLPGEGKINGNAIEWTTIHKAQDTKHFFKGKIEGEVMSGTHHTADLPNFISKWTAKRKEK